MAYNSLFITKMESHFLDFQQIKQPYQTFEQPQEEHWNFYEPQKMLELDDSFLSNSENYFKFSDLQPLCQNNSESVDFEVNNDMNEKGFLKNQIQFQNNSTNLEELSENFQKSKQNDQIMSMQSKDKNAPGNIMKSALEFILAQQYSNLVKKICDKYNVNLKQFKKYIGLKKSDKKGHQHETLKGIESMSRIFQKQLKSDNRQFYKILKFLLKYIFRTKYMSHAVTKGKMKKMTEYIEVKNSHMLYFFNTIQNKIKSKQTL